MAENSQDLVVDASIVVKWFVPEQDSKQALELRDAHAQGNISLYAPDLLVYEVANALRYRTDITEADIESDISALFQFDMTLVAPSSKSASRAASKARLYGITLYDAAYLELAEDIAAELVTADSELCKKAEKSHIAASLKDFVRKS